MNKEMKMKLKLNKLKKKLEVLNLLRSLQISMPCEEGIKTQNNSNRIPLFSLLEKPRDVLTIVVNVGNIHKINVMARCLGLRSGECYALLIRNRFSKVTNESQMNDNDSCANDNNEENENIHLLPSKSDTVKWLKEIEDLSLGVETAEWLSMQISGFDKQVVLEGAVKLAKHWKYDAGIKQHLEEQQTAEIFLKRLSSSLLVTTCETAVKDIHPKLLNELATLTSHHQNSNNGGGGSGGTRLKDLLSNPTTLIMELYSVASLEAAKYALFIHTKQPKMNSNNNNNEYDMKSSDELLNKCSTIDGLHSFAQVLLTSIEKISLAATLEDTGSSSSQSHIVPISNIRQKLVRDWLERPLSAKSLPISTKSSSSSGSILQNNNNNMLSKSNNGNSVVDDTKSVYRVPLRVLADQEDSEIALRVAVLLAPLSNNNEGGSGKGARSEALRVLLDVAVGRLSSAKQTSRTHLRALRALSLIASPKEMNSLINLHISSLNNNENGNVLKLNFESFGIQKQDISSSQSGDCLVSIATQGIRLAQVAWLEELHLPTQGLLEGLGESLVRALWRDHSRELLLPPLLMDILLTVSATQLSSSSSMSMNGILGDANLWISLISACIDGGHWRELLHLLPRFGIALRAAKQSSRMCLENEGSWSESKEKTLIQLWDSILRRPLMELEQRSKKNSLDESQQEDNNIGVSMNKNEPSNNGMNSSQGALPSLSSSIVFGNSFNVPPVPPSVPTTSPQVKNINEGINHSKDMEEFCGLSEESVLPVLELVISGLRNCPFLSEMDLCYYVCAMAAASKHYKPKNNCLKVDVTVQNEEEGLSQQIKSLMSQVSSLAMGPVERERIEQTLSIRVSK